MGEVCINFTLFKRNHSGIDNNDIYYIRREIANMFENAEFGMVQESDDDKFHNTFAIPDTDMYYTPENDLFISYHFALPIRNGNLGVLLLQGIPALHDYIENHYHNNMLLISRIIYT